jgi:hypothetical protein
MIHGGMSAVAKFGKNIAIRDEKVNSGDLEVFPSSHAVPL